MGSNFCKFIIRQRAYLDDPAPASGEALCARAEECIEEVNAGGSVLTRPTFAFVVVELTVSADETGRASARVTSTARYARPVIDARYAATPAGVCQEADYSCDSQYSASNKRFSRFQLLFCQEGELIVRVH